MGHGEIENNILKVFNDEASSHHMTIIQAEPAFTEDRLNLCDQDKDCMIMPDTGGRRA